MPRSGTAGILKGMGRLQPECARGASRRRQLRPLRVRASRAPDVRTNRQLVSVGNARKAKLRTQAPPRCVPTRDRLATPGYQATIGRLARLQRFRAAQRYRHATSHYDLNVAEKCLEQIVKTSRTSSSRAITCTRVGIDNERSQNAEDLCDLRFSETISPRQADVSPRRIVIVTNTPSPGAWRTSTGTITSPDETRFRLVIDAQKKTGLAAGLSCS